MAFNMLANVLVHSLVDRVKEDVNQRSFLMLLHILVQILVLILSHMLIHTLDEASSERSIVLVYDISFLTFNGPLIEIIASHSGKAVTSAARTHFDGRILVDESGGRIRYLYPPT
jgi:hypothetical protein